MIIKGAGNTVFYHFWRKYENGEAATAGFSRKAETRLLPRILLRKAIERDQPLTEPIITPLTKYFCTKG